MSLKSFRDRNPYVIGIVSVGIIGAFVAAAFAVGILHLGERAYEVRGVFADAGGIHSGDDVMVAGVKVGRVTGVEADRRQGRVFVDFLVNDGIDLGRETTAEVALKTLLGTKFLRLDGPVEGPFLADVPRSERVIPIERTKTPFDVFRLTKVGTEAIEATDTEQLNKLIGQLAAVTEGKHDQIGELLRSVDVVSEAITSREAQLQQLLERAQVLSATLAEKDETLVGLIDQSQAVLDLVNRRRTDIGQALGDGASTVEELSSIVAVHKTQLDAILTTLHPTVAILERRAGDVDRSLSWVGSGTLGLAKASSKGPWQEIYIRSVGPDVVTLLENVPPGVIAPVRRIVGVLLAVVALAAGLGACSSGDDGYRLTAYFARGVSLYEGSDVRVLGLPAGEIESVAVEGTQVRVVMTVRSDIPIPEGVEATLVPLSLIGERYVQLFPAWTEGQPRLAPGAVIPIERTSVPVEPDEALAALKRFLDGLDPTATGRLITNLADDLEGNGQALNDALGGIAELTVELADKDEELVRILEHFDEFTATLATREQQLGRVLDSFATTASVLAEERRNIERLVAALGQLSTDGLDLVSEHRLRLQRDVEILTRTLLSVQANMASVRQLLDAAPIMVAGEDLDGKNEGLNAAYDPVHHRIDLRNATSPILQDLFRTIGLPSLGVCVPVGVVCPPDTSPLPTIDVPGVTAAAAPAPAPPPNPVGAAVDLLGSPTDRSTTRAAELAGGLDLYEPEPEPGARSGGLSGWLRSAGRAIAEVLA